MAKIHWRNLKILFSRSTGPISTKLGTKRPFGVGTQSFTKHLILKKEIMVFFIAPDQRYDITIALLQCIYWLELVSQVNDGPHVKIEVHHSTYLGTIPHCICSDSVTESDSERCPYGTGHAKWALNHVSIQRQKVCQVVQVKTGYHTNVKLNTGTWLASAKGPHPNVV